MNEESRDKVQYIGWGQFVTQGVALASQSSVTAQISCILEETESFASCPNCATIQNGYQCLAVQKAQATDVIG
jgi:hypothetical protein